MTNNDEIGNADALVIFGITGDLAKKMTYRSLYNLQKAGHLDVKLVGVAMDEITTDQLIAQIRSALDSEGIEVEEEEFSKLSAKTTYVRGDFTDSKTFQDLKEHIKGVRRPLYYLEIPPFLFAPVVGQLASAGLMDNGHVLIEKPFGHDLESAKALNDRLHAVVREDQILRIDHFLGKQSVLDLLYLRFANYLFEPMWNRSYIASVQITLAESFGVEDRGHFYDPVGALRDVVQNHLLQVLAAVAMEAPTDSSYRALWDRKIDVFRSMEDVDPAHCVRGQYQGYQEINGVAKDSQTETYVALKLHIDNWRWSGVPFFIRAGKAMATTSTEIAIIYHKAPRLSFIDEDEGFPPNRLVLRIDPNEVLKIQLISKSPDGEGARLVHLDLPFGEEVGEPPQPYERLLHSAIIGNFSLFTREDTVEETWRVLQPLISNPPAIEIYEKGSWGPEGQKHMTRGYGPWVDL
ncbi:MAG: glucose-6-phosphate dehydrogenase [Actinomycetota bacterium]|nr:glucose-6-phosphate dehydrogenase [Actinomycetota bacterium]